MTDAVFVVTTWPGCDHRKDGLTASSTESGYGRGRIGGRGRVAYAINRACM